MTVYYGVNSTKVLVTPSTPQAGTVNGTLRCFAETYTMTGETTSDTIVVGVLPKGSQFLYGILNNSATLGSSTVAIGISGTTGKYRAAATKTTTTPEVFGVGGNLNATLTADETVFITIAAATMPSSGTLQVTLVYVEN